MKQGFDRRQFLERAAAMSALMAGSGQAASAMQAKPLETVRLGFIGVGGRGSGHVRDVLRIPQVKLNAVCDINPTRVEAIQNWAQKAGQARPEGYSKGPVDYKRLCANPNLDAIYVATPWELHVPMCVEAMKNGKHAIVEVPAATTLEECWQLVETSEATGKYCIMIENCNYDRVELMALNMARKNLFGELVHAECGYLHDLRGTKFSSRGEGLWRLDHAIKRNADLYPTHGLGPVAQTLGVNRGNLFDHMVSMASKSEGLREYARAKFGADSPQAKLDVKLGDVVSSLIRTRAGQTILVVHDTNLPRPYSRKILLQGTKGVLEKYPTPQIYIEGRDKNDQWVDLMTGYAAEFEHPLWKELQERAKGAGHGGMDFVMNYRLMQCLIKGEAPDMDVYDAAALSAVTELSERSIASRSKSVDFPDFTRGKWRSRPPFGIVTA
ncbi:MAG: Gfo/Idh/MocA family oxidoreductase [Bryobacteraceae bacterium]|nr:Gfo/Idh/MocA family oxidoreductase [Bryobacteraceae bacterium]